MYILLSNQCIPSLPVLFDQQATTAFPTGLLLLLKNRNWALHLSNLDLWKEGCFSILVTITLLFQVARNLLCWAPTHWGPLNSAPRNSSSPRVKKHITGLSLEFPFLWFLYYSPSTMPPPIPHPNSGFTKDSK